VKHGLTRTQLIVHGVAFAVIAIVSRKAGFRQYIAIAISLAVVALTPAVARWYTTVATKRAKLTTMLALMLGALGLIVLYGSGLFDLTYPPPHPAYWLVLAFMVAIPLFLLVFALREARRLLAVETTGGVSPKSG